MTQMLTIGRLLVAVDFSEASARAIAAAGAVADRTADAELRLLHAESMEVPAYFTAAQLRRLDAERTAARRGCEEYLREFGRRSTSVPFGVVVVEGAPAEAILHEGATANLIAMGTHGRRGPSRWWLGSVAERVLRETATPLLVVHAEWSGSPATLFSRPLLAQIGGTDRVPIPDVVSSLAARFNGQLIDPGSQRPGGLPDTLRAHPDVTAIVAPMPHPLSPEWLVRLGEPLLHSRQLPVLFVPAPSLSSSSASGGAV